MRVMALPTLICRAPAKVNLTLAVRFRRPDGYHELESWVTPIGLADELTFEHAPGFSLSIDGHGDELPADERNLVSRAARALAAAAGVACKASIRLKKRIPVGAGLGGGSSDAAATLLGLNRLWELGFSSSDLAGIAAGIGADVPLFLAHSPVVMRGRGEKLEPLPAAERPRWIALVVPPYGCATRDVYSAWTPSMSAARLDRPWERAHLPANELMRCLFNDLEAAAFAVQPALAELHRSLDGLGGRTVRMTGSGSALFTLFDDVGEAAAWKKAAASRATGDIEILVLAVPGERHENIWQEGEQDG